MFSDKMISDANQRIFCSICQTQEILNKKILMNILNVHEIPNLFIKINNLLQVYKTCHFDMRFLFYFRIFKRYQSLYYRNIIETL